MNVKFEPGSKPLRFLMRRPPAAVTQSFAHAGTPPLELVRWFLAQPLPPLSDRDERYTTKPTIRWVLEQAQLERFDLDVAACRESHHARDYFGLDHPRGPRDGLALTWNGHSFGNVPFTQWAHWIAKAWLEFLTSPTFRSHAMILPNDRTEQLAWQQLVEPFRDDRGPWLRTRFLAQRTKYSGPGMKGRVISNRSKKGGSPFFSSVLLLWSRSPRPSVVDLGRASGLSGPVPLRPLSHAVLPRRGSSYARRSP